MDEFGKLPDEYHSCPEIKRPSDEYQTVWPEKKKQSQKKNTLSANMKKIFASASFTALFSGLLILGNVTSSSQATVSDDGTTDQSSKNSIQEKQNTNVDQTTKTEQNSIASICISCGGTGTDAKGNVCKDCGGTGNISE